MNLFSIREEARATSAGSGTPWLRPLPLQEPSVALSLAVARASNSWKKERALSNIMLPYWRGVSSRLANNSGASILEAIFPQ